MKKISKKNITIILTMAVLAVAIFSFFVREFSVLPQPSVFLMPEIIEPKITDKVLIISPHQDDETLAVGGYIQKSISVGAKVKILLVTDGNRRKFGKDRDEEFYQATSKLGVARENLILLNFPDGQLKNISSDKLSTAISAEISNFSPTIVFYPDQNDRHPDHNATGQIVESLLSNKTDLYVYSYLVHYKYFPQPIGLHKNFYLLPPTKLVDFSHNWQKFSLSDGEEDKKSEAVSVYKSQLRTPILHDLVMAMIRKNELFSLEFSPENNLVK